jgi:hypothetical protein
MPESTPLDSPGAACPEHRDTSNTAANSVHGSLTTFRRLLIAFLPAVSELATALAGTRSNSQFLSATLHGGASSLFEEERTKIRPMDRKVAQRAGLEKGRLIVE